MLNALSKRENKQQQGSLECDHEVFVMTRVTVIEPIVFNIKLI